MSSQIDTPQRREAVRGSAEVSAAKHLARAYGVSMRRRRRVGPVVFDIGTREDHRAFGELRFTDAGRVEYADVFGWRAVPESLVELATVLEFGRLPEAQVVSGEVMPLVLETVPNAVAPLTTGPILVTELTEDYDVEVLAVVEVTPDVALPFVPAVQPRRIRSVPIAQTITLPPRQRWKTVADRQAEVLAELPSAVRVWAQFALGLVLGLQLIALLVLAALAGGMPPVLVIAMSVVAGMIGVGITVTAIHRNDFRLERLRAVGLR